MLHKFFAVRSSRRLESKHSRRLELEPLEDRVSPALVVEGAPAGPFMVGGTFNGMPGTSTFIPQDSPAFFGLGEDFSTFERGFFNDSSGFNVTVLGTGTDSSSTTDQSAATGSVSPSPAAASPVDAMQLLGQMQQVVGALAAMAVAQTGNPSQVVNLAVDEFFATVDAVALPQANSAGINTSALQSDLTARQAAIQNNPVDHTPIGQMLGTAVQNTTLFMVAINRAGGT